MLVWCRWADAHAAAAQLADDPVVAQRSLRLDLRPVRIPAGQPSVGRRPDHLEGGQDVAEDRGDLGVAPGVVLDVRALAVSEASHELVGHLGDERFGAVDLGEVGVGHH
jgi:hypothetical protein